MIRSSKEAVDLIVAEEVSSKEVYIAKYQHPEWPGGASGVTVGIGYDLGFATRDRILSDWKDFLTPDNIMAMQSVAGLTGDAARRALAGVRSKITVPWEAAMAVFMNVDMPKWEAIVARAVPGSDQLPAGCFGVLTSLAYNRGASFSKAGDRYKEMRDIRAHVMSGDLDRVPADIRSMKRLWPDAAGLRKRRDHEAALWERSLLEHAPLPEHTTSRVDTGDDKSETIDDVTPAGNPPAERPINVQHPSARYDVEVEAVQRALVSMNYHEVGNIDGKAGGKFVAGVCAFMTDRGQDPNKGRLTPELKAEINKAKSEILPNGQPWSRPIDPARANATATDIAPKVASINQTFWQKVWGYLLGIPAAATATFKWIFGDYNDPSSFVSSVKDFFSAIPTELYLAAVAVIAAIVVVQAIKAQNATVKAYQRGEIN